MTRSRIFVALAAAGLFVVSAPAAYAQTSPTIVVPAPSASPTVITPAPAPSGTTVIAPPGSTVIVQPPARTTATAVVPVTPWCSGAYATGAGTNFGGCPAYAPR